MRCFVDFNVLSNAVKFTPDHGRVDVSAKLDTDKAEIAVKDTGVGISPEDQVLLFEEFKQLGKDSSRKAEGTGLGLALTKRLVELHGGRNSRRQRRGPRFDISSDVACGALRRDKHHGRDPGFCRRL
jgi:signal transduction histidine kinase